MNDYQIRLGYACISVNLREADIFTSRTIKLDTFDKKGVEYAKNLALQNIDNLLTILVYNEAHSIRLFRISSCIFPHLGNPRIKEPYDISFAKSQLKNIGNFAKKYHHRLSMHPGQFTQLGTPSQTVLEQSIVDLTNHALILKEMGLTDVNGAVIIIHGGGVYNDKKETLKRWKENFLKLPTFIRNYIVLENDEFSYSINDLLPFCEELNIPFCLDIFHNRVSKDRVPITKSLIKRIFETWKKRSMIPKIHVSEQQEKLRRGAHSKTLDRIPRYLFRLPYLFQTKLDMMLEVKDKDISVLKMYYKYFNIKVNKKGKVLYYLKDKYKI